MDYHWVLVIILPSKRSIPEEHDIMIFWVKYTSVYPDLSLVVWLWEFEVLLCIPYAMSSTTAKEARLGDTSRYFVVALSWPMHHPRTPTTDWIGSSLSLESSWLRALWRRWRYLKVGHPTLPQPSVQVGTHYMQLGTLPSSIPCA